MGIVSIDWAGTIKVKPYKTDMNMFKTCKLQDQRTCSCCKQKIPKGSIAYGKEWYRLCIDCVEPLFEKGHKAFKEMVKEVKLAKENHKLNKDKWININAIAKL